MKLLLLRYICIRLSHFGTGTALAVLRGCEKTGPRHTTAPRPPFMAAPIHGREARLEDVSPTLPPAPASLSQAPAPQAGATKQTPAGYVFPDPDQGFTGALDQVFDEFLRDPPSARQARAP